MGAMKRLAGVAVVLLAVVVLPSATHAQTSTPPCEAVFVDTTGRVKDTALVEAAASRLAAAGAFVRVRVESNVGSDADARMRLLEASCPDWRVGSKRRPDLISIIVLTDTRKTGIYYGAKGSFTLDNSWRSIQNTEMNPRFKEGFFDSGIADGLDGITAAVTRGGATISNPPKPAPGSNGSLGDAVLGAFILLVGMGFAIGLLVALWKALAWLGRASSKSTSAQGMRDTSGWVDEPRSTSRRSSWSSSSSGRSGGSSGGSSSSGGGGSSSW
jgi:uncharacterized membrane protein YgcG